MLASLHAYDLTVRKVPCDQMAGRREEEYAMARYDEEARRHHHHHNRRRSSAGSDEGYYKKTVVRRERSSSGSPHRKRHIAEGALAGAGLTALLSSRRNGDGELPEHRGRKVVAGAALGALGTEVVRRAHSAYQERYGEDERGRSRSRERSQSRPGHSRINCSPTSAPAIPTPMAWRRARWGRW